jgi:hypothetical protein
MEENMRRIVIIAALLLGTATAVAAQAPPQSTYKHLIRPNGQKRSHAVYQRRFGSSSRQAAPSYDPGPTSDPSPPPAGPDFSAGMNTPTNPIWPGFNP